MGITFALLKSMLLLLLTKFITLKRHLNKGTAAESKNYQIKQALTKCKG